MRKQPQTSPPQTVTPKRPDTVITQVREYRLITPLYGGGVTPNETDPVTVVRATEIRGHLRFWWRACRGGMFKEKLQEEEHRIWGKAYHKDDPPVSQAQTIQIVVEPLKQIIDNDLLEPFKVRENDRGQKLSKYDSKTDIPDYAAFPLQHTQEELQQAEPPSKTVCDNVAFRLTISFPVNRRDDVAAALWAWETFGGIGARTRRGFGALRCMSIKENNRTLEIDLPQRGQQVQDWIEKNLTTYVADGSWATSVPHLTKQGVKLKVVNRGNANDSWAIWNDLINRLRSFRQQRSPSTKPNARHPGRSKWPEPSAIRQLTHQSLPAHRNPIPHPLINKFPRAAFGLPIIFQFKDCNNYNFDDPYRDPRKTVLQLAASERLGSPLILKPMACQGETYVGLALILEGTRVDDEQLILQTQKGQEDEWEVEASFEQGETLSIPNGNSGSPVIIDSQTNALQAFLKYL